MEQGIITLELAIAVFTVVKLNVFVLAVFDYVFRLAIFAGHFPFDLIFK